MVAAKYVLFVGWAGVAALNLALAISCFAAASLEELVSAVKFYLVWLGIVAICFSVASLFLFARRLNATTYGGIAFSSVVLANIMLMTAVLAGKLASDYDRASLRSVTAFSSLALVALLLYSGALAAFQNSVLEGVKPVPQQSSMTPSTTTTGSYAAHSVSVATPIPGRVGI